MDMTSRKQNKPTPDGLVVYCLSDAGFDNRIDERATTRRQYTVQANSMAVVAFLYGHPQIRVDDWQQRTSLAIISVGPGIVFAYGQGIIELKGSMSSVLHNSEWT
ncbi:hypothetical protein C8J56DRAFT_899873 [Mycena floridula]|nr:hypothetical protein C8J56DRAFT_899873 [Mycena floridula]